MPSIKVLSFNIHKGFGYTKANFTLLDLRDQIQETGADFLFLQEVVGENKKHQKNYHGWPDTSQFEFLADVTWPHMAYGKNAIYNNGHHGNAILSRFPIKEWENINISTNRFEKRGLLHATVRLSGLDRPVHLLCLHFNLMSFDRKKQVLKLVRRIENHIPHEDPIVIGGDFNDWNRQITHQLTQHLDVKEVFLSLHGNYAVSFPSWFPFLHLDRIYVRGFTPKEATVLSHSPWRRLSDHIPLLTTLEYTPP